MKFLLFLTIVGVTSAASLLSNFAEDNCIRACPLIYLPVCGYNGNGKYQTFDNDCVMQEENCKVMAHHESIFEQVPLNNCEEQSAISISNKADEDICNKPCLDIYLPVCGYNGQNGYKVFASECDMNIENCNVRARNGYVYMQLPMDMCDKSISPMPRAAKNECPKLCTLEYNPICGFNGVEYNTFGNKCDFEIQRCESNLNWVLVRMGECPQLSKSNIDINDNCNKICTANYLPVCGLDEEGNFHSYGNLCEFEMFNCNSNYNLKMIRDGEC